MIFIGILVGVCFFLGEFLKYRDVIDISMFGLGILLNIVGDFNRFLLVCVLLNEKVFVRLNVMIKGMRLFGEIGFVGL